MTNPFRIGDKLSYTHKVSNDDVAAFDGNVVHHVYSTFSMGRDAEWSGRLFVLQMKEDNEEGIGTFLSISHLSPAFVGQEVVFIAQLAAVSGNEVHTRWQALVHDRLIAEGEQKQKIVKKERLQNVFKSLQKS